MALIEKDGSEVLETYTRRGSNYGGRESDNDLFFAPGKKEGWINVNRRVTVDVGEITFAGSVYPTKEEALAGKSVVGYLDTIKIQWEE